MKLRYFPSLLLLAAGLVALPACEDDTDYTIATGEIVTGITTGEASFTAISAEIAGTVTGLDHAAASSYEVGVLYGTASDPTATGTKVRGSLDGTAISASLSGLTPGTTYYYCTYALLQGRVYRYGSVKSFVATEANVATAGILATSATTATLQGQYRGSDGIEGTALGFKIATTATDVENSGQIYYALTDSIGERQYILVADRLLPSTTYYAVAFMTLGEGTTEYGETVEFKTPDQNMEYVDLGLSVFWAQANLGGERAYDSGVTFTHAEASAVLESIEIDADANYISALPTQAQIRELFAGTTQQQTVVEGVRGLLFSAPNGNSIFLPEALYWSADVVATHTDYAYTLNASGSEAQVGSSAVAHALGLRTVAEEVVREGVRVRRSRVVQGDLENNGNYRVELYNEYGVTKSAPAILPSDIRFDSNMKLTFSVSGVPSGKEYRACYIFADDDWNPSSMEYHEDGEASCLISGDGTYSMILHGAGEGAKVFCFDILGLSADTDPANVHVEVETLVMDAREEKGSVLLPNTTGSLSVGDLENNGRIRIEIYNEYGATKGNSIIDPNRIVFAKQMAVTFRIAGIDDNLRDGAAGTYVAGLEYSDPTWGVSYWSDLNMHAYEAPVTGDGIYTVWCEVQSQANGAVVFCIDIKDLATDLIDAGRIEAEILDIRLDTSCEQPIFPELNTFQNKDGNGTDGRIEIYNEYGNGAGSQVYNSLLAFSGMCLVEFSVKGIDGNLRDGAVGSYTGTMSFADQDWNPSYWGGAAYGNATITSDGTYQVYTYLKDECRGAVVWTIELYGLWKDLVETEKVEVAIQRIVTPHKL